MSRISAVFCRLLIVTMIIFPFTANAGMIATDTAIATTASQASRDKVREFMNRDSVASELRALGVSPALAQERVDSMTQQDVDKLAGKIETMPAGAMADGWIFALVALVIGGIIWAGWGPKSTR